MLREDAEEQLARSPKLTPDFERQTQKQLIHELQVHQIELETQAEELRRAHVALGESRDEYRDLYEFAPMGYLTLNDKALITDVNLTGAMLLGVERSDLLTAPFSKFFAQKNTDLWHLNFVNVLKKGEHLTCNPMLIRGDGSTFPARLEGVRITGSGGAITVRISISDITDIRQVEEALRKREGHLKSYLDNSPDGVFITDETGRYLEVNPAACRITGYEKEELLAMHIPDLLPPESLETGAKHFKEVIKSGHGYGELRFRHKDGSLRYWSVDAVRLSPTRFMGFVKDITKRKRSEAAVRESEERYHTIFHQSPIAIELFDATGTLVHVNPASLTLFGIVDILAIQKFSLFADPNINDEQKERLQKGETVQYQGPFDFGKVKKLGLYPTSREGIIWLDVLITPLGNHADSARGFLVQAQDITERKQAEKALQESEEKYRGIFDESVAAVYVFDNKKNFINSNQAGLDLLGYSRDELLQLSIPDVDADPVVVLPAHQELLSGGRLINYEHSLRRKDETIISVINNSSPLTDLQGNIVGMISTLIDITERRKTEDSLRRVNQKLNVLSQLTRTELISQIFLLDGYVGMAKSYATGQDRIIETLQKGEKAIRLLRGTIAYSKDYQDMGVTPPGWQNVKRTMLFGLSHLPISEIKHSLETENLEVFADPLLEKAYQRLFENSLAHGDHVSRVRVWHTVTPDGVNLVFEDNGVGIPVEMKEQIFLHDEDTRTSVRGLFFIREILDITGITIQETGEPGKGARFEMAVPNGMWRLMGSGT